MQGAAFSIQSLPGMLRAPRVLEGRVSMHDKSVHTQKMLSAHDVGQTVAGKARAFWRKAGPQDCIFASSWDTVLHSGKKSSQRIQEIDDIHNESECSGLKL